MEVFTHFNTSAHKLGMHLLNTPTEHPVLCFIFKPSDLCFPFQSVHVVLLSHTFELLSCANRVTKTPHPEDETV